MPAAVGFFAVAAILVTLGAQAITYRHLWTIARRGWARMDRQRRRRTVTLGLGELVLAIAVLTVVAASPFGARTFAYLILGIAAVAVPLMLLGVGVQARRDIRATRERRRGAQQRKP